MYVQAREGQSFGLFLQQIMGRSGLPRLQNFASKTRKLTCYALFSADKKASDIDQTSDNIAQIHSYISLIHMHKMMWRQRPLLLCCYSLMCQTTEIREINCPSDNIAKIPPRGISAAILDPFLGFNSILDMIFVFNWVRLALRLKNGFNGGLKFEFNPI